MSDDELITVLGIHFNTSISPPPALSSGATRYCHSIRSSTSSAPYILSIVRLLSAIRILESKLGSEFSPLPLCCTVQFTYLSRSTRFHVLYSCMPCDSPTISVSHTLY